MICPAITNNEDQRLKELEVYKVLDTLPEKEFDEIASLAAQTCETPIALVSFIDSERQWFKAVKGVEIRETLRNISFCGHTILDSGDVMKVEDTLADVRFWDNPLVTKTPKIRAYAGAPIVGREGNALGTVCVVDTKPRKFSNEQLKALQMLASQVVVLLELRKQNEELLQAKKIAGLGYWTYDVRTKYVYWSEEIRSIWDLSKRETFEPTLESFFKIIHPEDQYLFEEIFENTHDAVDKEVENRIIAADGTVKWINQKIISVVDATGAVIRYEGVARDITEKKKLESDRETILESIQDGFFAVDDDWTVTYWNSALEEILKIPKSKILNKNLWKGTQDFVRLKPYEEYYQAFKNKEKRTFEANLPDLGIWVESSVFPKPDGGMSIYVKDITERKNHQREIFKAVRETQERERSRFGRDLHDGLTQSLTAIKMNLSHFSDRLKNGETRMGLLSQSLAFLDNAINESRNISHGLLSLTLEKYGLQAALEEIVENINQAGKVKVELLHTLDKDGGFEREMEANIYRIAQEALNNVIKHSRATEAVVLLLKGSESVQLVINDNGIGLTKMNANIRKPGAGLANIRARVSGLGGEMSLLNQDGAGLQINIKFPL